MTVKILKYYKRFPFKKNAVLMNFLFIKNPEENVYGFHKDIKQHSCFQH